MLKAKKAKDSIWIWIGFVFCRLHTEIRFMRFQKFHQKVRMFYEWDSIKKKCENLSDKLGSSTWSSEFEIKLHSREIHNYWKISLFFHSTFLECSKSSIYPQRNNIFLEKIAICNFCFIQLFYCAIFLQQLSLQYF